MIELRILRKGRCDLRIELPKLTHTDIVEYLSFIYEDQLTPAALTVFHSLRFNALTGCDLQDLVLENIDSFSEFLSAAIERGFAKAI